MGMGTQMCHKWEWDGKSTRDNNENGNGYFFTYAKIPNNRLDANASNKML